MTARPSPADLVGADLGEFVALRRALHAAPELSGTEANTSALVAEKLRAWGYEVTTGIGGHGLVGTLRVGQGNRSLGLRADMDALPISEQTNLAHASRNPGVMHACGHDGHTTILLAAAKTLAARRAFDGTLHVIFQPAEEDGDGARNMIADGLFTRFPVDAVYGLHNWPGVPVGDFRFIDGPAMASVELYVITLRGPGGHGARPHETVDPIVAASALVLALQSIIARNIDPVEPAVVTVGSIHGGNAPNVIPDSVELQITVRAFSDAVRKRIRERIFTLAEGQARAYGVTADIYAPGGFPELINHRAENAFARDVARDLFGPARVGALPPIMASEDFAYMLQARPGAYLFVGNGPSADLHSPHYDFNDAIIADAAAYWVALSERYFARDATP